MFFHHFYVPFQANGYKQDICSEERKMGKVVGVSVAPPIDDVQAGDTLDVTIRISTLYPATGLYVLSEKVGSTWNSFIVPKKGGLKCIALV